MERDKKLFRIITISTLIALSCFIAEDTPADDTSSTDTPSTAENISDTLQKVGTAAGNVQMGVMQSQLQTQAAMNTFAALRQQSTLNPFTNPNLAASMSTFQQAQVQLSSALGNAFACLQGKGMNASVIGAGAKAKKPVTYKDCSKLAKDDSILNDNVTCINVKDTLAALTSDQKFLTCSQDNLGTVVYDLTCLQGAQTQIGNAANQAKQAFVQMDSVARDAVAAGDKTIKAYQAAIDKLSRDLDGTNSDGYKAQVQGLEDTLASLNNALDQQLVKGQDGQVGGGLKNRILDLQSAKNRVANQWYNQILTQTISCFNSQQVSCTQTSNATAISCIQNMIASTPGRTGGYSTPNAQANAAYAAQQYQAAIQLAQQQGLNTLLPGGSLNSDDPNGVLTAVQKQFMAFRTNFLNNVAGVNFQGLNATKQGQINLLLSSSLNSCYQQQVKLFQADLNTTSSREAQDALSIQNEATAIRNDANQLTQSVSNQMNKFRTSFFKVYHPDLPQFTSDCRAQTDPASAVNCLDQLRTMLDNGLHGTGGLPPTTINVPTANGNVTTTCSGFIDCVNVLDTTRTFDQDQQTSLKQQKDDFVIQHNKTIETQMGALAAQFSAANSSGMGLDQMITAFNAKIASLGISAILGKKQIEGEALTPDPQTGLLKPPKDMKAALAAQAGYAEIDPDSIQNIFDALKERQNVLTKKKDTLVKKNKEAKTMKGKCTITEKDYDFLKSKLNSFCKSQSCYSSRELGGVYSALESILRKSLETQPSKSDDDNSDIDTERVSKYLRTCTGNIDTGSRSSSDLANYLGAGNKTKEDRAAEQQLSAQLRNDKLKTCFDNAQNMLDDLNAHARDDLKSGNGDLISNINDICSNGKFDSNSCSDVNSQIDTLKNNLATQNDDESSDDDTSSLSLSGGSRRSGRSPR